MLVASSGLSKHQEGRACRTNSFVRRMHEKGWVPVRFPSALREIGIPGEFGPREPVPVEPAQHRRGTQAFWHPKWVTQVHDTLKKCTTKSYAVAKAVWTRARDDETWRDAFVACASLDEEAPQRMIDALVRELKVLP